MCCRHLTFYLLQGWPSFNLLIYLLFSFLADTSSDRKKYTYKNYSLHDTSSIWTEHTVEIKTT